MADFSDENIAALRRGETIQIRPRGNSMTPKIRSGELCTIAPIEPAAVEVGDAVLVELPGRRRYLHLVKSATRDRVLIGNAHGRMNGWASREKVYGKLVRVDP